ncbi:hypothetical protein Taro_013885 [Colocasia esculenta]|uniref:Uncharacterized protein n=1 Tax=Colocasia esculenta TaxID=4460 RepID=A0A843UGS7_COLES|nr:hypothetical protein [Colocasia esculenta]
MTPEDLNMCLNVCRFMTPEDLNICLYVCRFMTPEDLNICLYVCCFMTPEDLNMADGSLAYADNSFLEVPDRVFVPPSNSIASTYVIW